MDETAKARDLEEQIARARQLGEPGYEPVEGWRDPFGTSGLTQYELGLLHSQTAGHRWHAWRRLNGDQDYYFAACSCGWRSFEANSLGPVLGGVRDHLEGVRVSRGYRPAAPEAQVPAQDEREPGAGQHAMPPAERARELRAFVQSQQERLRQALERSGDLLSASEDQADRRVAGFEHAAAHISPERASTGASARRAQAVQRELERAKELHAGVVAAAAALAAIAEEVALVNRDLETRAGSAEYRHLVGQASRSAAQAPEVERTFSD